MLEERESTVTQTKSLKKVRTQFLHKKEDSDETKQVDATTKYLSRNNMFKLHPSLELVEIDRKICAGAQYSKEYFKILYSLIETKPKKGVALNIELNKHMAATPWSMLPTFGKLKGPGDSYTCSSN